jgi:hypothetical protein
LFAATEPSRTTGGTVTHWESHLLIVISLRKLRGQPRPDKTW